MTEAEEILNGSGYFNCKALWTRISTRRCLLRQEMERPDCVGCEQGRKIREMNHESMKIRKHENTKGLIMIDKDKILEAVEKFKGVFKFADLLDALGDLTAQEQLQAKNALYRMVKRGVVSMVGRGLYKNNKKGAQASHQVNEQGIVVEEADKVETGRSRALRPRAQSQKASRSIEKGKKEKIKIGTELAFNPWGVVDILREAHFGRFRERLVSAAEDNVRTVEQQIVWYIKRGLEFDRMKKVASKARGEE